jgi:hypothetical protein
MLRRPAALPSLLALTASPATASERPEIPEKYGRHLGTCATSASTPTRRTPSPR